MSIAKRAGALCATLLLALSLAPARADEAADLLAKHKAFAGWQFSDRTFWNVQTKEVVRGDGDKPVATVTTRRIGIVYRADTHDEKGNTDYSDGFTGRVFWYSNENGFTVPVIGDSTKVRLGKDFFFTDGAQELPWKVSGERNIWNKTYKVVEVSQVVAGTFDLLVDPGSGAYGGAIFDPKGDNEEIVRVLDYGEPMPGKKFIKRWQIDGSKQISTVESVDTGASISDAQLHPPAATAHWDFANSDAFPVKVTNERIIIKASVNGVEGTFLLDTGASNIYLSGEFARRAKVLGNGGHVTAYTVYGKEKNDTGQAATVTIGGNTLHDVTLYYGSDRIEDAAPDGLFGFDVFAGSFVSLDLEKKTLRLQDPATVDPSAIQGVHIATDLASGTPAIPMDVQGKSARISAEVDTGNPLFILIPSDFVIMHGIRMADGDICGQLDDMSIGPIVYQHVPACNSEDLRGTALIGYDFLKGFGKIYFDYSHAGMILAPKSKS